MQDGTNIDVIYLDFAKAFDKVDFGVTLHKMKKNKTSKKLGRWLYSFLTDRTQMMLMNGAKFQTNHVQLNLEFLKGLGPILFLILIGNVDKAVSNDSFVFRFVLTLE